MLLDKDSEKRAVVDHIKSLKDVVELNLTPNPNFKGNNATVGDNYVDRLVAPWICPMTSLEMNGRFKFVYDLSNGNVLSERAYKMLKDDDTSKIKEENLVILNPTESDADLMATKMEMRKARAKAEKKAKKEAKRKNGEVDPEPTTSKEVKKPKTNGTTVIQNKSDPTTSKVASSAIQSDPSKSEVYKSLFSSHKSALNKPKGNWVTYDPRYN